MVLGPSRTGRDDKSACRTSHCMQQHSARSLCVLKLHCTSQQSGLLTANTCFAPQAIGVIAGVALIAGIIFFAFCQLRK
jgi:hypothetical protein